MRSLLSFAAVFLFVATTLTAKENCRYKIVAKDVPENQQAATKVGSVTYDVKRICQEQDNTFRTEFQDENDDQDDDQEEEVHERVKRSPFWGGSRSSSRSSSSRSSSSRVWGGGRRTSSARTYGRRTSSTSGRKSGGWFSGRSKSSSSKPASTPKKTKSSILDKVHTALDVAGLAPGVGNIADGLNAGLHAVRGNWKDAALSAAAMVPGAGQGVTAAKLAKRVKNIDGIIDSGKVVRSFVKKGGKIEEIRESAISYKHAKKIFDRETKGRIIKQEPGKVIGRTKDGRILTIRDRSKTGPATLDVNNKGDITKVRCTGCEKPK